MGVSLLVDMSTTASTNMQLIHEMIQSLESLMKDKCSMDDDPVNANVDI